MSILYAISGIALNHMRDFNPNFNIHRYQISVPTPLDANSMDKQWIESLLDELDVDETYKQSYFPNPTTLKVFLKGGNFQLDVVTGKGLLETVKKRPVLYQVNFLHYNPGRWWKWFSDVFCVAWIIISVTGLFIIKSGKHSIKKRGALWTLAGIILPVILLLIYG